MKDVENDNLYLNVKVFVSFEEAAINHTRNGV